MKRRAIVLVLAATTFLAAATFLAATLQSPGPADDLADRIDAYVAPLLDAGDLSGTLLVARGDRIVYERSFGMADYELETPNTHATRFGIASVNKLLTAIAALRLAEQETVSLDDPISNWLPDFPRSNEITVGHLLTHRSGLPHRVIEDVDVTSTFSAQDMTARAAAIDLRFEPGSERGYSSAGYSVLARVLEVASGRPFAEVLAVEVLEPAGAVHTVSEEALYLVPQRAKDYLRGPDGPLRALPANFSYLVGAGSAFSTPGDLFRVMRQLVSGGYGRSVLEEIAAGSGDVHWNGRSFGYRAFVDYHAASDLTVAFASNLQTGAADLIRHDVPALANGETVEPAPLPSDEPVILPDSLRQRISGVYQFREGMPDSEEELRFAPDGRYAVLGDWILLPVSERKFISPLDYAELSLERSEDDEIRGLRWRKGEDTFFLPRVRDLP